MTRRMMVMGKMKVKMKVKGEDGKDLFYPCFDLAVTVQNAPHRNEIIVIRHAAARMSAEPLPR